MLLNGSFFFLEYSSVVESVSDCNANCNQNTSRAKYDIKDIYKGTEDINCRDQGPASQQNISDITGTKYTSFKVWKRNVVCI